MKPGKAGLLGFTLAFGNAGAAGAQDTTVVQRFSDTPAMATSQATGQASRTVFGVPSFPTPGSPAVPDITAVQQSFYGTPGYSGYGGYPGYGGYGGYGGFSIPYGGGGFPYGAPGVPLSSPFGAPTAPLPSAAVPPAAFGLPRQQPAQEQGRTVFGPPSRVIDLSPSTASTPKAGLPAMAVPLLGGRPYTLEQVADPSSDFYGGTGLEGLDARQAELADVAQAVGLKAGHAAEAVAMARALRPYEQVLDQRFGAPAPRSVGWRDYLIVPAPSVVPPSGLAAVSRSDRAVWRRGVELGWSRGVAEARRLFADRLDALVRTHPAGQPRAEATSAPASFPAPDGGGAAAPTQPPLPAGTRRQGQ